MGIWRWPQALDCKARGNLSRRAGKGDEVPLVAVGQKRELRMPNAFSLTSLLALVLTKSYRKAPPVPT
jgi:hypothetical protein